MYMERKAYFISLDKRTIKDVSVPDTTEYEVWITPDELKRFEMLFRESDKNDSWFALVDLPLKPFAEEEVDDMRREDHENLMKVYQFIYHYGTRETRRKLKEVGYEDI